MSTEQLRELEGKTIWFTTAESDMNSGTLKTIVEPNAEYVNIEQDGRAILIRAQNIFKSKADLIDANECSFLKKAIHNQKYHEDRVNEHIKKGQTVEQLLRLFQDYRAMKEALAKCSETLLDDMTLMGLLD